MDRMNSMDNLIPTKFPMNFKKNLTSDDIGLYDGESIVDLLRLVFIGCSSKACHWLIQWGHLIENIFKVLDLSICWMVILTKMEIQF